MFICELAQNSVKCLSWTKGECYCIISDMIFEGLGYFSIANVVCELMMVVNLNKNFQAFKVISLLRH